MKGKLKYLLLVVLTFGLISTTTAQAATQTSAGLSKTKATISVGGTVTLKVTGTKKKVKWSTSNKKVATVNGSGKVAGKKVGKATITAKVGGKTLKCKVKVKNVLDVAKTKITVKGTGRVKVNLHEYATVLCNVMDASCVDASWGRWTSWTKDGTSNYLTIKGKKKGTVKIILTNSYNTEQHEIDVTVKEAAKL